MLTVWGERPLPLAPSALYWALLLYTPSRRVEELVKRLTKDFAAAG